MRIRCYWIVLLLLLTYDILCVQVIRKSNDSDEILVQDMKDCKKFKNATQISNRCVCIRKDAIFHKMNGTLGCFTQSELGGNMPTENMNPTIRLTKDSIIIMDDSFKSCPNKSQESTRLCRWTNDTWVEQQKTVIIDYTSKFDYSIPTSYHGTLYRIDVFCSDHHTLTLFIGLPGETEYHEDMIEPPSTRMEDDSNWLKKYAVKVAIALLAGILFLFATGACIIYVRRKSFKMKLEVSKNELSEKEKDPVTSQVKEVPQEPEYEYIDVARQSLSSPTTGTYQGIDPNDIDFISTLYHMLRNETYQKQQSITKDPTIAHEYENEDHHDDNPPREKSISEVFVDSGRDFKLKFEKTRYENMMENYKSLKSTGILRDHNSQSVSKNNAGNSKIDADSAPSSETNNDTSDVLSEELNKIDDDLVSEYKNVSEYPGKDSETNETSLQSDSCELYTENNIELSEPGQVVNPTDGENYLSEKEETCL